MKTIVSIASAAFAAATLSVAGMAATPAHATGITTPASACRPAGQPSIAALTSLSSNQSGTSNGDLQLTRKIICPVVRAGDNNGVTVYVDGQASEAAPVACILYSYNYDGTLKTSKGFVEKRAQFDHGVTLTAAEAPVYAYLNVICSMPSAFSAKIFGVLTVD